MTTMHSLKPSSSLLSIAISTALFASIDLACAAGAPTNAQAWFDAGKATVEAAKKRLEI